MSVLTTAAVSGVLRRNVGLALAGQYAFTHLASGRACRLPHRHSGPCDLRDVPATEAHERPRLDAHRAGSCHIDPSE